MLRTPACLAALLAALLPASAAVAAQNPSPAEHTPVEQAYTRAVAGGELTLRAFLAPMPKGADLHMHLSGAVYAESWLRQAAEDGMCVDPVGLKFDREAQGTQPCKPGELKAADALRDQTLYNRLIDAFSMRTFIPVTGESGHDHFFASFDRFGGVSKRHRGEWLDEVATRAAAQNEQYLEIMETPSFTEAATLAARLAPQPDLHAFRDALLAAGLRNQLPALRDEFAQAEHDRRLLEHCDTPAEAQPACQVQIRFLFQVLRGMSHTADFAQMVEAYELISSDPQFVGLNLVRAEDWLGPLTLYRDDMRSLAALGALYPKVHLSLHAGELAPGLVAPSELAFHVRVAVEQAHAERIGHGVDILFEEHPQELLAEMAKEHTLVEINLTSNDVILNMKGEDQPLLQYLAAGVPVALSTDDEGVSRIDLTHEYVRAAVTYHLRYAQLRTMARASLEHSFLPGESLWEPTTPEQLTHPVAACRGQLGAATPTGACAARIAGSEKAAQQWELEHRLHIFEAGFQR